MSRLRSDLWSSAFVRRHNHLGHICVVSRRGDAIAGQIWIEVDHLDGTVSLFTPAPGAGLDEDSAEMVFQRRFARVEPLKVRERIEQEARFDPDLWVLSLDLREDNPGINVV